MTDDHLPVEEGHKLLSQLVSWRGRRMAGELLGVDEATLQGYLDGVDLPAHHRDTILDELGLLRSLASEAERPSPEDGPAAKAVRGPSPEDGPAVDAGQGPVSEGESAADAHEIPAVALYRRMRRWLMTPLAKAKLAPRQRGAALALVEVWLVSLGVPVRESGRAFDRNRELDAALGRLRYYDSDWSWPKSLLNRICGRPTNPRALLRLVVKLMEAAPEAPDSEEPEASDEDYMRKDTIDFVQLAARDLWASPEESPPDGKDPRSR